MTTVLAVAASYLVGGIPGWRLVERVWGVDLRRVGSGNPGAGNAARQVGLAAGVALAVFDALKGLVPVLVAPRLGIGDAGQVMVGLAAVTGNNWPVWHGRRGGRGLAVSVGVVLGTGLVLILWPGVWAMIGWAVGGGLAGFVGWGMLPVFAVAVGAPVTLVLLTVGLAALMVTRRAEGNAGWTTSGMLERIIFDRDARPTTDPSPRAALAWPLVLFGVGLPVYVGLTRASLKDTQLDRTAAVFITGAIISEFGAKWAFGELFRDGLIRSREPIGRLAALRAALVGTGVARLVPAGGAITPVAMAWATGTESTKAVGAALRATVLNYGGLSLATGLGLGWVVLRGWTPGLRWSAMGLALLLGLLGVILLLASSRLRRVLPVVPRRLRSRVESALVDHHLDRKAATLVLLRVVLESLSLGLTLVAFDVRLKPSQVVTSFGVSQLVGGLPGTPGGAVYTEVGLLGVLGMFGVPAAVGAGPVLVFRLVSYWLPALTGAMAGSASFLARRRSEP